MQSGVGVLRHGGPETRRPASSVLRHSGCARVGRSCADAVPVGEPRRVLLVEDDDGDAFLSATCWPRSTRTSTSSWSSPSRGAAQRPAGALGLRPARPEPARHHRPGRAARHFAGRQRRGGLRPDRSRRRAPRHRRGRGRRAGLPRQGQGGRRGARPGDPLRGRAAARRGQPPATARGAARGGRVEPPGARPAAVAAAGRQPGPSAHVLPLGPVRAVIGGDFFDAVLGPSGTVHAIVGDVCGHGRTRRRSVPCCGCRGGRWSSPASTSPSCCPSCSRCSSASGTSGRCSPPPPRSP